MAFRPHLVKHIVSVKTGEERSVAPQPTHTIDAKPEHIALIRNALVGVNKEGTSARAFANAAYTSGGKTGTAQVYSLKGEKYYAHKIDERLRDHAWFIAYAPADKPKIALAVLVENGGFGAQAAAPIARKVLDYALLGQTEPGPAVPAPAARGRGPERLMRCRSELLGRAWEALTRPIDSFLLGCALALVGVGLVTLFSAADQSMARVTNQVVSLGLALVLMWIVANISPLTLARTALPLYVVGVLLLVAVALFGISVNGSRRWLNLGVVRIQPSELMKIALPLMLAWYFQKFEGRVDWKAFVIAAVLIVVPVFLVKRQPDLGTSLMIAASGFYVLFLAGLSWKVIVGPRRWRAAPRRRSCGRSCASTSASGCSRSSIPRAIRWAPAITRRRRRSRSGPAA